jgi:hypothetical protein
MSVTASNMARNEASASIQVGDDTLTITYYPNKVTSKLIAQLDDVLGGGLQNALSTLIKSWDLQVSPDDSSMYPTDPDSLEALGLTVLLQLSKAIASNIRPN